MLLRMNGPVSGPPFLLKIVENFVILCQSKTFIGAVKEYVVDEH